jgi:hypothetical protein
MQLPEATQVRLDTQLDCLAVILDGVSPEALNRKSDHWSAVQNLAHLGRYHEVFLERLERIRAQDGALLRRYSAETDSAWPAWSDLPLQTLRSRLQVLRSRLVAEIRELPDEFVTRKAVHTHFGEMHVVQWVEFFLLHEAHHLYKVFQLAR